MVPTFSVQDTPDSLWSSPPVMSYVAACPANIRRSSSERLFQKFLEEEAVISKRNTNLDVSNERDTSEANKGAVEIEDTQIEAIGTAAMDQPREVELTEYATMLKQQLDMYCHAVAIARGSGIALQGSFMVDSGSPVSDSSQLEHQAPVDSMGSNGVAANLVKSSGLKGKTATSGSSKDQSEDDDLDVEIEINDSMDPAEIKRLRRMISNRESARRSRKRRQTHLNELELQVSQLKDENTGLLKRLTYMNCKHNEASVDNRVLKADLETLKTKVKMAEESVKRVTGSCFPSKYDMSYMRQSHDSVDINEIIAGGPKAKSNSENATTGPSGEMEGVASLDHSQKRICWTSSSSSGQGTGTMNQT